MNQKMIALMMSGLLAVTASLPAAAADTVSVKEIRHLSDALTGNGKMTAADDYNQDGVVNAVDLTLMKRAVLCAEESGELTAHAVTAIAEHTKLTGRTLTKNGVTWLVQSGSAVECTVTGTEASVTVAGDSAVHSDEKYRPRYGVYVDGELIKDVVMGEEEQTVKLFSGEKSRTAIVKIMHLSEANNGAVGVKRFDVTSQSSEPVKPVPKKDLTIEFIGDSITCAYGVGAENQYVGFETGTEDFSKSYAYLTAGLLDADYSAVSYSGHGILSGYTGNGEINTEALVPPVYENVAKSQEYAVPWDFAAHPSDVVIINLGTNDDSYCKQDLDTLAPQFQKLYTDFLKQVRKCNPDAYIICTLGIMGCEELYPYIEAAVKDAGDSKISCYQSPTQNMNEDGLGADWHPSSVTHQKNAYLLADRISTVLGRAYSRNGVDFAADGTYASEIKTENGANGWAYYSEWNNTMNMKVTAAGKSPEDITVSLTGLELPAGEYALSFTVKGAENLEFPYVLKAGEKSVYEGTVSGTACKAEIKLETAVSGGELQFQMGALSAGDLTFENISLVKMK